MPHPDVRDDVLEVEGTAVSQARHKIVEVLRFLRDSVGEFYPVDPRQKNTAEICAERCTALEALDLPSDFAIDIGPFSTAHGATKAKISTGFQSAEGVPLIALGSPLAPSPRSATDFFQRLLFVGPTQSPAK